MQATTTTEVPNVKPASSTTQRILTTTAASTSQAATTTLSAVATTKTATTTTPTPPSSKTESSHETVDGAMSMRTAIEKSKAAVIDTGDDGSDNYQVRPMEQMVAEFGEPAWISMSAEEDMIRLDWSVPEGSLCDAFFVNYTILTLTRPKSFSVATADEFTVIKDHPKEIDVKETGPVLLDKLEPAQAYHIAVRNESIELGIKSKPAEIERITPPLISSTLFPGKITSTSININFGESDLDQGRFDHYELVFTGNNKNITKRIEMNQEMAAGENWSPPLQNHKPQKTRHRTHHPLKVNELYPVVGREYVVLYWDVENFADSDCRFRLSYNADKIPTVSVELKGASRHRFAGLTPDVYYTFTITVIMGTGKAAAESESEMITVYVPRGRLAPSLIRQGSRELKVAFENDQQVFSPLNGEINNVAVIVSDDTELKELHLLYCLVREKTVRYTGKTQVSHASKLDDAPVTHSLMLN
ncbi:hypothetical protein ANCCEY_14077 [Ancylostoma ceylanicum]|uniref:Fibronectin type III domain protein n=1 Tax=Ancylostoma ceylanicum TaxID=53326 RepID=A0A0D6L7E0_9BILA|nr:hypothetical protein ANCCEY_14077 [Ancylostoma ceylanicum]